MKQSPVIHFELNRDAITKHVLLETKRYLAHDKQFWLRSEYQSNKWKIIDNVKYPNGGNPEVTYRDIDFTTPTLYDGTNLTDIENEHWNQLVRACLCFYRAGVGDHSTTSGEQINTMKNSLVYLIDFLKLNRVLTLSQVTPSFIERFVFDYLPYGPVYFLNWRERISILVKQYRYNLPLLPDRNSTDKVTLLAEANIPEWFSSDEFFKELINHCESLQHRRGDNQLDAAIPIALLQPDETLTSGGIRRYTSALVLIFEVEPFVRGTGIETLPFNPVKKLNISDLSNKALERTRTIPPKLALKLISQSITYIEKYSDGLVAAYQYLINHPDITHGEKNETNTLFDKYRKRRKSSLVIPEEITSATASSNTLHKAIFNDLVSACTVILMAFSARRESEIYDLRVNCRDYKDLLKIYIAKTDKSYDLIPKVAIVDKALNVLTKLSKHNRITNDSSKIFEFSSLNKLETIKWAGKASFRLNAFAERVDCHIDDWAEQWRYSEHQFRRFFAMMYYWYTDSKNIEALSYQLRHFSLDMTHKYIEEVIAGDVVRDVAKLKTKSLLYDSNDNNSPMGRDFKKRINAYKKYVLTRMNILNVAQASKLLQREYEDNLSNLIDTSIENANLIPEIKPWGKCFGKAKGRQVRAKCVPTAEKHKRNIFSSRAANASCEDCMNCSNLHVDEKDIPFINIQLDQDTQVLKRLSKQKNANPSMITWLSNRIDLLAKMKKKVDKLDD